jgi:acetoin utilization protein AcuB
MPKTAVSEIMTRDVITIDRDLRVNVAIETMRANGIRRLPVVREGSPTKVIGMVTLDQARLAMPKDATLSAEGDFPRVRELMTDYVYTIGPDESVGRAAELMVNHTISSLPVVDESGDLIGIVTESDLFKYLARTLGNDAADDQD